MINDEVLLADGSTLFLAGSTRDFETTSGNPWHDPQTGKFSDAPPGMRVLRGAVALKDLPNGAKRLISQRRTITNPDALTADPMGPKGTRIIFFKGSRAIDKFNVPSTEAAAIPKERPKNPPVPELNSPQRPGGNYEGLPDLHPVHRAAAPQHLVKHHDELRHSAAQLQSKLKEPGLANDRQDAEKSLNESKAQLASIRQEQANLQRLMQPFPGSKESLIHAAREVDHHALGQDITSSLDRLYDTPVLMRGETGADSGAARELGTMVSHLVGGIGGPNVYNGKTEIRDMPAGGLAIAKWDGSVHVGPETAKQLGDLKKHVSYGQITGNDFEHLKAMVHEAQHITISPEANDNVKRHYAQNDRTGMFLEEGLVEHQARHHLVDSLKTRGVSVHGDPLSPNADRQLNAYQDEYAWVERVRKDLEKGLVSHYGLTSPEAKRVSMAQLKDVHQQVGDKYDRLRALDAKFQQLGLDLGHHVHDLPGEGPATDHLWKTHAQRIAFPDLHPQDSQHLPTTSFSPKRFSTIDHAHDWAATNWDPWLGSLDTHQTDALAYYTTDDGYRRINAGLRGFAPLDEPSAVAHIDDALEGTSVPDDVHVWRGIESMPAEHIDLITSPHTAPGHVIHDKGFVSTSLQQDTAGFIAGHGHTAAVIRIDLPKGSKAGYLEPVRGIGEYEMLLPRDTKIQITSYEGQGEPGPFGGQGQHVFHGRVVQQRLNTEQLAQALSESKGYNDNQKMIAFPSKFSQKWLDENISALTATELTHLRYALEDRGWKPEEIHDRVWKPKLQYMSSTLDFKDRNPKLLAGWNGGAKELKLGDHFVDAHGREYYVEKVTNTSVIGKTADGKHKTLNLWINEPVLHVDKPKTGEGVTKGELWKAAGIISADPATTTGVMTPGKPVHEIPAVNPGAKGFQKVEKIADSADNFAEVSTYENGVMVAHLDVKHYPNIAQAKVTVDAQTYHEAQKGENEPWFSVVATMKDGSVQTDSFEQFHDLQHLQTSLKDINDAVPPAKPPEIAIKKLLAKPPEIAIKKLPGENSVTGSSLSKYEVNVAGEGKVGSVEQVLVPISGKTSYTTDYSTLWKATYRKKSQKFNTLNDARSWVKNEHAQWHEDNTGKLGALGKNSTPDELWNKGLMNAKEYKAATGKFPPGYGMAPSAAEKLKTNVAGNQPVGQHIAFTHPITGEVATGKVVGHGDLTHVHEINGGSAKIMLKHSHETLPVEGPGTVVKSDNLGKQLTLEGAAGGTTGAKWYVDDNGTRWVVKDYNGNKDQVATELLANAIYRELGVPVPQMVATKIDGENVLATKEIHGKTVQALGGPKPEWNDQMKKGFMADALLANWDVAGTGYDNMMKGDDGTIYRVDHGGTFEYRAQGGHKDFGSNPTEHLSLLQHSVNPYSATVFAGITDDQKAEQARRIAAKLTDEKILAAVASAGFSDKEMQKRVANSLKQRRDAMFKFHKDVQEAKKADAANGHNVSEPLLAGTKAGDLKQGEQFKAFGSKWEVANTAQEIHPSGGEFIAKNLDTGKTKYFDENVMVEHVPKAPTDGLTGNGPAPTSVKSGSLELGDVIKEAPGQSLGIGDPNDTYVVKSVSPSSIVLIHEPTGDDFSIPNTYDVTKIGNIPQDVKTESPTGVLPPGDVLLHSEYPVGMMPPGTVYWDQAKGSYYKVASQGGTPPPEIPEGFNTQAYQVVESEAGGEFIPATTSAEAHPVWVKSSFVNTTYGVPNAFYQGSHGGQSSTTLQPGKTYAVGSLPVGSLVSNDQGDIYKIASKDAGFTYLAPHDMVGGGNYEGEPSKAIHPALPVTLEELPAGSNGQSSLAKGDVVDSIQLKPGMKVTDQHANVDTISPNAVMTVQQGPQGLEIVDNKGDHVMDVTGGVYVKIVDAGGSGGPSPEHLAMVGKEVNGSQIVDGMVVKEKWAGPWKVVTKKEAQKTSPDVMYISAKYFLQNPDGSIEKEVVPKFHYTVTDVSGVGGTSLEGKTVKGTQLAPGMKIATDTYPVLTVASTHVSGSPTWYHLLDPDGHIVQNVVPGQNYKVLDTSQVASQAKQTLGEVKIGAHVNVNGKEWLVTGVQGPSSVTLKDPLSDQTQTLHHLTEASVHPEDTLNPNVLESGKLVHQALPASYPLPPKMSQGWIETHVPQMTEKQVSNLIWSLKGKGWNSQEIADRVMPHTQKAKGKAFSSVEQQLGWAIDPNTGHKMFTSHKAGDAWAKSALGGIKKRATSAGAPNADKMWSSLSSYFGSGYSAINGWLRKGKGTDTNVHAKAAAIKEAFKYAAKAPEDFIAFRGTEWPVPLHHGDALIGDYVRDKGFQSASYLRSSATSWGKVAKLVIPEGTPVIWANDSSLSGHPGEKEILFPAGSIYRIIAMEKHGSSGKQQMVLKWVGYDGQFKVPAEKKLYGDDLVNHVRELVKLAEGHYMIVGAD